MAKLSRTWMLAGAIGIMVVLGGGVWLLRPDLPPAPRQPIDFPHTVHAGRLALPCNFCHAYADKSRSAGVPPLSKCMSCHRHVAAESPEIGILREHFEKGRPVSWVRVHSLPPFVYFSHKRHIRAKLECTICHGEVRSMARVRQVRPLKMGWCLECHRERGAPTDCATCHQ